MKTTLSVVDTQGGRAVAPELVAAREIAVRTARATLALFGVTELISVPSWIGVRTVNDIEAVFHPGLELPPSLLAARKTVARSVSDYLLLFGVLSVKLEYADDDLAAIRRQWLPRPADPKAEDPDLTPDEIAGSAAKPEAAPPPEVKPAGEHDPVLRTRPDGTRDVGF